MSAAPSLGDLAVAVLGMCAIAALYLAARFAVGVLAIYLPALRDTRRAHRQYRDWTRHLPRHRP